MPIPCQWSESGRTDSSPSGSPPKVRTLDTFQSFPPKGDTSSWTFPPNPPKPGQLKGGATVVDMKWLSYPFWYGYAWLSLPGYCDFVIDFWSPIKFFGSYTSIKLVSLWRNRTRASYSTLLTSLLKNFLNVYYLFSFPLLVMTCLYSLSISILESLPLYEWFPGGISIVCILVLCLFYKL